MQGVGAGSLGSPVPTTAYTLPASYQTLGVCQDLIPTYLKKTLRVPEWGTVFENKHLVKKGCKGHAGGTKK